MNDNYYFFLIFLFCSFILIAGFSLTYYVNNNSYKKFLDSFSPMEKYANLTYYEKAQAQAEKNITYNPTLIIIFGISCICILFLEIIILNIILSDTLCQIIYTKIEKCSILKISNGVKKK